MYASSKGEGFGCLDLEQKAGSLPVWAQLLERCVRSNDVGAKAMQRLLSLQADNMQQHAHAAQLQQQLAAAQAQLVASEARADGLQ
ncbi:hypothetical protein OEZ85_000425 [Tetradesmus obliquus]|uniref:Uncharacterized protein n=1 Tax=Tetradesmus obliquus TaxID=3088 RepID=A0ABY8UTY4_TETOB|nr:hypothetical protein OEZ85_000425 [Tetradesmus obliquus]